MRKEFMRIAKKNGVEIKELKCNRYEFSSVNYSATILKQDGKLKLWDDGYFIGEENTANSKDKLLIRFEDFVKLIK